MDSSLCFDTINMERPIVYIKVTGYNFTPKILFLSLMIVVVLENSVDPDEMPHYAAFQLGLHCLPKSTFLSH